MTLLPLLPSLLLAGASITIDGQSGDWAATQTCFPGVTGNANGQVDLQKVCLENDSSPGNTGSLFLLMQAASPFPSQQTIAYGYGLDHDKNGKLDQLDSYWDVVFPATGPGTGNLHTSPIRLEHWLQGQLVASYLPGQGCGGPAGSNGWSAQRTATAMELAISYGCLGLSHGTDNLAFQAGVFPSFDSTAFIYYDGTSGSMALAAPPPDVIALTARAIPSVVQLKWTNPAQHDGVLILRSTGAPPNTRPLDHFAYLPQQLIGNATVLYSDNFGSTTNTFTNTGLTNGTRYYYRVYNHWQNLTYSLGDTPPGGIWGEPQARTGANPLWCYSTGYPNTLQPVTDLGVAVYGAGNLGAITANVTDTATASNDGTEKFRPVSVGGPVQQRFLLSALAGHSGKYAVAGDQNGHVTAIDAATGAVLWVANGGLPLGERVQGQPIAQLASRSNAAYQAAHPGVDLIFVGTRNTTAPNKVVALSSIDGQPVWSYAPGDLGMINGGFMVDYQYNRLFVASRGTGSLRVLDSVTGQEVAPPLTSRFNLGDIDTGVVRDQGYTTATSDDSAFVVNTTGTVTAIDITNLVQRWSVNVGPTSTFVAPTGSGFIASVTSGSVQRWRVITGPAPELMWSAAVPSPSGVRIDYVGQKIFAGGSDGYLYELDAITGAARQFPVDVGQAVGTPTIDTAVNRLHVGSLDGRLCSFGLPFP